MEDLEEPFFTPNSWIPIKALKRLMGLDEFITPSDPCSEYSFGSQQIAETPFFPDKKTKTQLDECYLKEEYIKSLESSLSSSETQNSLLKKQLETLERRNFLLASNLQALKRNHMIKLQNLQEQHQRKLQKSKKDLDFLLKEMNRRSNFIIFKRFLKIHQAEINRCRARYEDLLEKILIEDLPNSRSKLQLDLASLHEERSIFLEKTKRGVDNSDLLDEENLSTALNSERTTCDLKRSSLESTQGLIN